MTRSKTPWNRYRPLCHGDLEKGQPILAVVIGGEHYAEFDHIDYQGFVFIKQGKHLHGLPPSTLTFGVEIHSNLGLAIDKLVEL